MLRWLPRKLRAEAFIWTQHATALLPDSPLGSHLRWLFYRNRLQHCGRFISCTGFWVNGHKTVSIGEAVRINRHVMIDAEDGEICIGCNVLIGPYCVLRAADHVFSDPQRLIEEQGHQGGTIRIESGCWLGSHVVVTRNVTIGEGSVIGAHSVVTRDIPPYSIAMGVPAVVKGSRR